MALLQLRCSGPDRRSCDLPRATATSIEHLFGLALLICARTVRTPVHTSAGKIVQLAGVSESRMRLLSPFRGAKTAWLRGSYVPECPEMLTDRSPRRSPRIASATVRIGPWRRRTTPAAPRAIPNCPLLRRWMAKVAVVRPGDVQERVLLHRLPISCNSGQRVSTDWREAVPCGSCFLRRRSSLSPCFFGACGGEDAQKTGTQPRPRRRAEATLPWAARMSPGRPHRNLTTVGVSRE